MNKYLLFAGEIYIPGGGWSDYIGIYDSLSAAAEASEEYRTKIWGRFWWHIVSLETMDVAVAGCSVGTKHGLEKGFDFETIEA